MDCFSCFKSSTNHDPSREDPFEVDTITAMEISLKQEEEDRIRRQKREDEEEERRRQRIKRELEKDNKSLEDEKGKRKQVDDQLVKTNRKCHGCNFEIEDDIFVNAFGTLWHPQCFRCLHCHKLFAMDEIPNLKGRMYHKPCYKEHRRPDCYICENKIPSTEDGIIKYSFHPFWNEMYCPCHDTDGTAKCCSCERLESCRMKYVMLDDGRWLCRECLEYAVMDSDECCDLHLEIREFFEGLNMRIKKEFHLLLVEKEALNKAEIKEKIGYQYEIVTRGICLSEEQMITSVLKGPRTGPDKQLTKLETESQMVFRKCEVTAILILYGFPRFLTGCILAHEMMHAYLRLNGYRNLDPVLEEGLCQVLGHMWLESHSYANPDVTVALADSSSASSSSRTPFGKKGDTSDFEKKFVKFCKYQIETDDSPVYGFGFKKVKKMMDSNNQNLKDTLKQIVTASKTIPDSRF